jgi:hypothetical protein
LAFSFEYGNYKFPNMICFPSKHGDFQGGKAKLPHHLLGTFSKVEDEDHIVF